MVRSSHTTMPSPCLNMCFLRSDFLLDDNSEEIQRIKAKCKADGNVLFDESEKPIAKQAQLQKKNEKPEKSYSILKRCGTCFTQEFLVCKPGRPSKNQPKWRQHHWKFVRKNQAIEFACCRQSYNAFMFCQIDLEKARKKQIGYGSCGGLSQRCEQALQAKYAYCNAAQKWNKKRMSS